MTTRIKWLALILLLPVVVALAAAPSLILKDLDGKPRNVNEFIGKGQWVIVAVWSADCPICKREIFHMTFFHDEHKNKDARVLGLSIDGYADRKKARAFIEDQGLNFPNVIGSPQDASRLGNASFIGTPTYYFFAPDGKLAGQRVGPLTQSEAEEFIRRQAQAAKAG